MEEALCLQALVLIVDFKHLDICWRDKAAGCIQSRRFLEYTGGKFLTQVIEEPMIGDGLLKPDTHKQERTPKDWGQPLLQDHEMQNSGSQEKEARQKAVSQP